MASTGKFCVLGPAEDLIKFKKLIEQEVNPDNPPFWKNLEWLPVGRPGIDTLDSIRWGGYPTVLMGEIDRLDPDSMLAFFKKIDDDPLYFNTMHVFVVDCVYGDSWEQIR